MTGRPRPSLPAFGLLAAITAPLTAAIADGPPPLRAGAAPPARSVGARTGSSASGSVMPSAYASATEPSATTFDPV